ncbi:uncharacterized protein A1O9_06987 [Exophiala aquamarina CBS 119918]|uniref:AB hydrolase-1 domain-containing protein n=1 Tax=Exophiala aquamarina CBS 119918 TaxID=1182545 RepID=A0A072PAN8_9EURO|nr:uncharacterized protein A1O9_06987 [Exophiala aquamarina CBS 119918]KEF56797.1 hypothetical protein A1O9_06987 [Exophiala aquamarina CBS 119918]
MGEDKTNNKPVIVIVPGSFSNACSYYALVDRIQGLGYETFVNNLPSTSRHPPEEPANLQDDAGFFRSIIEKLADQGKNVVVVMHSYGGLVGSEAVKGTAKADRQASGKPGGVVKLIYLTATVLPVGGSMKSESGDPPSGLIEMDQNGFMRIVGVEAVAQAALSDVQFDRAVDIVREMPRHSALSFAGELTYPGYKHIPSSYICCENDCLVSPEIQRKYIDRIREATGKEVDVHNLDTGHAPNISATEKLAQLLVDVVGASV